MHPRPGLHCHPFSVALSCEGQGAGVLRSTMPTNLHEAETGGPSLVFAGDASGVRFRLREVELYDAVEVRQELHGEDAIEDDAEAHEQGQPPAFGRWIPAEAEDEDIWMVVPGELLEELQRLEAEAGEIFEVTRIEKSGGHETDPFEVRLEKLSDEEQTRL